METSCCFCPLGIVTSLAIELIQPLMDRSFDLNDLVLNAMGVAVSTAFFFLVLRRFTPS